VPLRAPPDRRRENGGRAGADEAARRDVCFARAGLGDPDRDVDRDDVGLDEERYGERLAAEGLDDPVLLEHDDGQPATREVDARHHRGAGELGERDEVPVGITVGRSAVVWGGDDLRSGRNGPRVRFAEVLDLELRLHAELDAECLPVEPGGSGEVPHPHADDVLGHCGLIFTNGRLGLGDPGS